MRAFGLEHHVYLTMYDFVRVFIDTTAEHLTNRESENI